ncbi:hypothetical protein [Parabacteroides bouchesdurhonensis]|uniref:hypothetical protein n=1 Tax=Parabacteroides bouchesdurhonensis TaxID=1936995 RepID=UPI000C84BCBC|nr:hypothetical protein [Parabacteroides bouchesdurhonensis]
MYNVPILFLIFARPDTTTQVFERIRQIKPAKLYVAADAPRENRLDEAERCVKTRAIIDKIDWPCELKTLYRDKNLGCKVAVSEAITWFFEQEEYGVILEDDCLPDLSFFLFCEELLIKYKDDDRIGHIGGNNFFPGIVNENLSYDFCSISHIWGWASWSRVWKNYDVNFSYWEEAKKNQSKRKSLFKSLREEIYFSSFIEDTLNGNKGINTWDVQYLFMLRVQNQLSIYPSVNLVTNIGLNSIGATHTSSKNGRLCVKSESIHSPLSHPKYVLSNEEIDNITVRVNFFSYKRILRYLMHNY